MSQATTRRHQEPPQPEFTEETARTIIRAILRDYEYVVLEELDRAFGLR